MHFINLTEDDSRRRIQNTSEPSTSGRSAGKYSNTKLPNIKSANIYILQHGSFRKRYQLLHLQLQCMLQGADQPQ